MIQKVNKEVFTVCRGGSWVNCAIYCRLAFRCVGTQDKRYYDIGVRVISIQWDILFRFYEYRGELLPMKYEKLEAGS